MSNYTLTLVQNSVTVPTLHAFLLFLSSTDPLCGSNQNKRSFTLFKAWVVKLIMKVLPAFWPEGCKRTLKCFWCSLKSPVNRCHGRTKALGCSIYFPQGIAAISFLSHRPLGCTALCSEPCVGIRVPLTTHRQKYNWGGKACCLLLNSPENEDMIV